MAAKGASTLISYQWEGINRSGEKINGVLEANSLAFAKAELRKQGVITKTIKKKRKSLFSKKSKKIKQVDISVFSRQLATMIEAGIPLVQAFDIVAKGQSNQRMRDLILEIKKDVESGLTLSEALEKHPAYFNDLFCNLVDAGEKSGSLEIMLDKVATYKEKVESIKKKIKKALTYPMAVMVVAFLVTAGLLIFVVPQIFESIGLNKPEFFSALSQHRNKV